LITINTQNIRWRITLPGIVREGDIHVGHASRRPNPFHQTTYVATQTSVYVNNRPVIVLGDCTGCGDKVSSASSNVFIDGKPIHRLGDSTEGHDDWLPNFSASASANVFAN
jgi:uncharacterized Zn-binding protein involved in type VI secretion